MTFLVLHKTIKFWPSLEWLILVPRSRLLLKGLLSALCTRATLALHRQDRLATAAEGSGVRVSLPGMC